ncbi:MAG: serine/threonine-protein kinase [Thermodesulfovibrionales bacterium]|nr:serine/threonine-protein kinase [Thermodesulfovibrionales bacterium]
METFGQYILLEKVATGGMAELFRAKKIGIEGFEQVLAVKRILPHLSSDEEFIKMFIAEAKLVAQLTHKNIAQIYDFGRIDLNYFISMEYIRGKDLKAILKKVSLERRKLPAGIAVFIAKEVAAALGYAHIQKDSAGNDLNIIHRDISPQNILVSYEGEVKIVDFGIAKASAHSKTTTGMLKGKLSYMSPEQASGKPVDHRSDIFSLGVVLYEMLTGRKLFQGDSEVGTLEMIRKARIEPLPSAVNMDMPSGLEAKVLKALAREASERYQNASDMELDLWGASVNVLDGNPVLALKQYMNDLFRSEMESERMAERIISLKLEKELTAGREELTGENKSYMTYGTYSESYEPEKPKKKEKPVKPVRASTPRRRGRCSCIIFLALAVSIIAGVFMVPSYKDKIIPSFSQDWFKKIPSINFKILNSWIGKTETPSESLDIAITLKSGRKLFWSNYFEEGDSYCTKKAEGKVCIPKDDVAAIYSVRKP